MDYYQLPRISNSDLTAFKQQLFGIRQNRHAKALQFGSALHALLLEPHTVTELPTEINHRLLQRLTERIREDRFCKWILRFSRKEQVHLFTDPETGLDCKSKLDVIYQNRLIVDFKTTSARSQTEFGQKCREYDYDRQAAFYLDGSRAKRFVLVGIQKTAPYALFHFEPDAAFIGDGRKKYKALLRKWKQVYG